MTLSFPVAPMKATMGALPADDVAGVDEWAFEIKWDGHRTLAHVDHGSVRFQSTSGKDTTGRWHDVGGICESVAAPTAIIDGEMLVIGDDGRPSFSLIQGSGSRIHPAMFHAFDLLELDGHDLTGLGYLDRRHLLREVLDDGDHWSVPAHRIGDGAALLAATAEQSLEGIVAKRTNSIYRPGTRSKDWIKVKNRTRVVVPIGGFTAGSGNRASTFGSLLVGHPNSTGGSLQFAGGVGTGFPHAVLEALTQQLSERCVDQCPFDPPPPAPVRRTATWVEPSMFAAIEIAEFTNDGHVRHASFVELVEK